MRVSIFTDASCISSSCGFAFNIGCSKGMIKKAGTLKVSTNDTVIAELHCLANALHTLKHCRFKPITKVDVYMDYISAVKMINGETRGYRRKDLRDIIDEIYFLMLDITIKENHPIRSVSTLFTFHHVKAHTGNKDKLAIINNWCDFNARKYAREENKKKKPK